MMILMTRSGLEGPSHLAGYSQTSTFREFLVPRVKGRDEDEASVCVPLCLGQFVSTPPYTIYSSSSSTRVNRGHSGERSKLLVTSLQPRPNTARVTAAIVG